MKGIENKLIYILIGLFLIALLLCGNFVYISGFKLSSTEFNNIVTPIAALIGIYFYSSALRTSREQNKLIQSQNLKDNYLKEIEMLTASSKELFIMKTPGQGFKIEPIIGVKFYQKYVSLISDLNKDADFRIDNNKFQRGQFKEDVDYFQTRTYNEYTLLFAPFIYGISDYFILLRKSIDLMSYVYISEMNNKDKLLIMNIVFNELIVDYLQLYKYENDFFKSAYIPDEFTSDKATFKKLFETRFGDFLMEVQKYDLIRKNLISE